MKFEDASALTVTLVGSGSGTVVSAPPGINCGAPAGACSASVASGIPIQLTASPATGSTLSGFTGCQCQRQRLHGHGGLRHGGDRELRGH